MASVIHLLQNIWSGISVMSLITGPPIVVATSALTLLYKAFISKSKYARWTLILYFIWSLCDYTRHFKGGRPLECIRYGRLWKWARAYFPCRVIRDDGAVHDPGRKYIIACHPHGVLPYGAFLNILTNKDAFPGIPTRFVTVGANFIVPVWRDVMMAAGFVDASLRSCQNCLRRGLSLIIAIGGAAESLYSRPGNYDLVLERRLGFIRLAMQEGADIIPTFTFGETATYKPLLNNRRGTLLRKLQESALKLLGFAPVLTHGRAIGLGILPYRTPLTTVIGKAFSVPQIHNPTQEEVLSVLHAYIAHLEELFDKYKGIEGLSDPLCIADRVGANKLARARAGMRRTAAGVAEPALNYGLRESAECAVEKSVERAVARGVVLATEENGEANAGETSASEGACAAEAIVESEKGLAQSPAAKL